MGSVTESVSPALTVLPHDLPVKTAACDELSMAMSEVSLGPSSSPAPVVVDPDPYVPGNIALLVSEV